MSASPHRLLAQLPLVCAILTEIDRQAPGALVSDSMLTAIIQAATHLVASAKNGGVFLPREPTP